ncbi:MAG: sigma-70 family RNA polymerase sigma factor [Alphaproteobacteria bacterium]|nr:sigma-70 family RNA polymerase sigma factor [Alphaproteobacteria bacterium]MBV9063518.1 sigma-70 family RNA polymerase sigma factor [Alphaproteobacteria bacterium]
MTSLLFAVGKSRDRAAFETLFLYFAPRVKAYLLRRGVAAMAAEDLAQEALLNVWNKAHLFDPKRGSAASWIFTVARNLHIDAVRRQKHPDFDPNDPALIPEQEPEADAGLQRMDDDERLRKALESLPPGERNILELSYFAEKPHSAIARELRLPLGTVKSRMRAAMRRIREGLLK